MPYNTRTYNEIRDLDLINGICSREDNAFFLFESRYGKYLRGIAFNIVKDFQKAEDIVQEVYITLLNKAETFDQKKGSLKTWVSKITMNKSLDAIRRTIKRGKTTPLELTNMNMPHKNITNQFGADEIKAVYSSLHEGIETTPGFKEIELFCRGHKYKEIAEIENIPIGTVKSRINYAKKIIRKRLEEMVNSH